MRHAATIPTLLLTLGVAASALAEPVWATESVAARRWVDSAEHLTTTVDEDARLDVVYREAGWVRVRLPGRQGYGWLPEDKVTTVEPAGADQGDFQLPGGMPGSRGGAQLPPVQLDLQ